jgi:uncharacterized protein (TIGR02145 family)
MISYVKIGLQIWSNSNLNLNSFRNGDTIIEAVSNNEWEECAKNKIPAWCNYNNEHKLGEIFGKIYNQWAILDPRGLAPEAWRIATEQDWLTLGEYLGGRGVAGGKIKSINDRGYFQEEYLNAQKLPEIKINNSVCHWQDNQSSETIENNESGFTALPGGYRNQVGMFMHVGIYAYWWSVLNDKKLNYKFNCNCFYTAYRSLMLSRMPVRESDGFYVRCVKC